MKYTTIIVLVAVLLVLSIVQSKKVSPFARKLKYDPVPDHVRSNSHGDAGEPLFLSEYLEDPTTGRIKSCVDVGYPFGSCKDLEANPHIADITPFSYSGYITVNETYDQNLFYWMFDAQKENPTGVNVLVIFLQGGPGASSLFSLFSETGPYYLTNNMTMEPRNVTWNEYYSMMYIDNPVGTGFSFASDYAGYSTNQDEISMNLYNFMLQFYKIYPQYATYDLYITGESYAGKYVPAFAYQIIQQNKVNSFKVPLAGIAVGDGLCDPITQVTQYANLAFYTGLADLSQQDVMYIYQDKIIEAILAEQWMTANDLFTDLIDGPPDYFQNITGAQDYFDIRRTVEPTYGGNFEAFVNQTNIRALLHVGNHYFQDNSLPYDALQQDIPKSIKSFIPTLLDNIKVAFYNGQFDFIVGVSLTETFIRTIPWVGIGPYLEQERVIWFAPTDNVNVAGYVRTYQSLTQIVVRGAGHLVPYDQPERAYDMITRFINNEPWVNNNN